jgi:hypothetical protein
MAFSLDSVSDRRRCPLRRFTQLQFDASMTEKDKKSTLIPASIGGEPVR